MNNELRNRALHLIAAHFNTSADGINHFNFTTEWINEQRFNSMSNPPIKSAINNALVTLNYTIGELTVLGFVDTFYFDTLVQELKSILSEINTKAKEKEAEEKRQWLANYEAERGEKFVCPHNNDIEL